MSAALPGCPACHFRGWVARGFSSEAVPCDHCGGLGVFARTDDYATRPPRTLAEIALTDEERDAIFARLRADRLARGGRAPPMDPALVARSVRASSRLAGVPDHIIDAALAAERRAS